MSQSTISVIITTFNRAHFVLESLQSVFDQTRPAEQIIVVNDGSSDNTREVLAPYTSRILYLEKENGGLASALNLGLENANGDYIYILDDDDAACPDILETHAAALDANPDYGFTYSPCYRGQTDADGRIVTAGILPLPAVREEEFLLELYQGCFLTTPGMLTRRECYESVGPYDTTLTRCEDYDLKVRLARKYRALHIDRPSFCRRVHDEPRGGGRIANFSMREFDVVALRYERPIFARFRDDLYLSEFLPCGPADPRTNDLSGQERREAILSRMAAMGMHGVWDAVAEDMAMAARMPGGEGNLTERERLHCWQAMSEPAALTLLLEDPQSLKQMLDPDQPDAFRHVRQELSRGIFYTILKYVKGVDTGLRIRKIGVPDRVKFAALGARLLGWQGAVAVGARKLNIRS